MPRWRLAREGPFLSERSPAALPCFGAGCSFRQTTHRLSDYAQPSGQFGVLLHHPRFLEWINVPESAGLLEMGPERWLHRDMCMMTTNLDVLDQYVLCLQGTASNIFPGSFLPQRWWWVPWDPEPTGLQYRWRPWDCGGLLWILYVLRKHFGLGDYVGLLFIFSFRDPPFGESGDSFHVSMSGSGPC